VKQRKDGARIEIPDQGHNIALIDRGEIDEGPARDLGETALVLALQQKGSIRSHPDLLQLLKQSH